MIDSKNVLVFNNQRSQFQINTELFTDHGYSVIEEFTEANLIATIKNSDISAICVVASALQSKLISLCLEIKKITRSPIILVSNEKYQKEIVIALEVGVDCYLEAGCSERLLLAQVNACIRRNEAYNSQQTRKILQQEEKYRAANQSIIYDFSGWKFNTKTSEAINDGQKLVTLTNKECRLLTLMLNKPKIICTRKNIMEHLRLNSKTYDKVIDIMICRIRAKLESCPEQPHIIKTVRSRGYILDATVRRKLLEE